MTVALFVAVAIVAFCSQTVQAKWYDRFWYGKAFDHRALYHACVKNHAWYNRIAADFGPWTVNQVAGDCWKFANEVNFIHNNTLSDYNRKKFQMPVNRVNADPIIWLENLADAMGIPQRTFEEMVLRNSNKNKKNGIWTTTGQVDFYRAVAREMRNYVENLQNGKRPMNTNDYVVFEDEDVPKR